VQAQGRAPVLDPLLGGRHHNALPTSVSPRVGERNGQTLLTASSTDPTARRITGPPPRTGAEQRHEAGDPNPAASASANVWVMPAFSNGTFGLLPARQPHPNHACSNPQGHVAVSTPCGFS
jgi:hypothetical protein